MLTPVCSSLDKFSSCDGCGNLLQQNLCVFVSTSDGFSLMVNRMSLIHSASLMQGVSEITCNLLVFYQSLLPLEPHYLFFSSERVTSLACKPARTWNQATHELQI